MRGIIYFLLICVVSLATGRIVDKRKCPEVRAAAHFDLSQTFYMSHCWARVFLQYKEDQAIVHHADQVRVGGLHMSFENLLGFQRESGKPLKNAKFEFKISRKSPRKHARKVKMLGEWYVVEYYASAEEALSYSCMKAVFTEDDHVQAEDGSIEWTPGVTMNFTYRFADDPLGENLLGNITWKIDLNEPAHWTHSEMTYDGIYNTYVLDTEYKTWMLLLHCAEQREGARYLSAFILSRKTTLPKNVMAYLRDKLPRYDVDVKYVFLIPHEECSNKPAKADYTPILVEVGSKIPKKPGVTYNVAFGN